MAGKQFMLDVHKETDKSWEEWISLLEEDCGKSCTFDQLVDYLREVQVLEEKWVPVIASMYEQRLGRNPVGLTKDVGFQIGVRRSLPLSKEEAWDFLTSREGLKLWIGDLESLPMQAGSVFHSKEGVTGKLRVVKFQEKLRLSWKREEWDNPSALQIYLLASDTKKTTIAFHQDKLDDLYMRQVMKDHWEHVLNVIAHRYA
jgi:uncharacterized protein YndB with AHSA1/START domain